MAKNAGFCKVELGDVGYPLLAEEDIRTAVDHRIRVVSLIPRVSCSLKVIDLIRVRESGIFAFTWVLVTFKGQRNHGHLCRWRSSWASRH